MSTRCKIGRMYEDGTVRAINVHYDGYPSGVGRTLLSHYDDGNIEELLDLGSIASLCGTAKETAHYADERNLGAGDGSPEAAHEAFKACLYKDDPSYQRAVVNGRWEYAYLLCDGEWLVTWGEGFTPLREALEPEPADSWIRRKKGKK